MNKRIGISIFLFFLLHSIYDCKVAERDSRDPNTQTGFLYQTLLENLLLGPANTFDVAGITILPNSFVIYGEKGRIYETTNGSTFTLYTAAVPDCTDSITTSAFTKCKVAAILQIPPTFTYGLMLNKQSGTFAPGSIPAITDNKFYFTSTTDLTFNTIGTITSITSSIDGNRISSAVFSGNYMHFSTEKRVTLNGNSYKLYSTQGGSTVTDSGITDINCNPVYNDATTAYCHNYYYFGGTSWVSPGSHTNFSNLAISSNFINSIYFAVGNGSSGEGIYTSPGPLTSQTIYTFQSGLGITNPHEVLYNTSMSQYLILASSSVSEENTTPLTVYSHLSSSGTSWSISRASGLTLTKIFKTWSFGNYFYIHGVNKISTPTTSRVDTVFFRSSDGINWQKVDFGIN
ncbi:MAG: hypothetical protein K8R21_13940 [Leptospira sp.]|nr:hypothetical protein [Leptospira sp.]